MLDRFLRSKGFILVLAIPMVYLMYTMHSQNSIKEIRLVRKDTIFDCRSWKKFEYAPVFESDVTEGSLGDNEVAGNRLAGWKNDWNNQVSSVPKSGIGSTLEATENIRISLGVIVDYLKMILKKDKIKILDCPCGDMTWMPEFLRKRNDVEYSGFDLIPMNIDNAKKNFANESWIFRQFDLTIDRIEDSYDLIINRHVNIHLGLLDSIQMYHNILQSGTKYLITTTFPDVSKNNQLSYSNDQISGRSYHRVNLHLHPFYFPDPICINPDANTENQHMGLWDLSELAKFNYDNKKHFRPFKGPQ